MVGEPSAAPPLLQVTNLTKRFGSFTALDAVSLEVGAGEIVAVLGHNGSGKSTLVKLLAGFHTPDGGTFTLREAGEERTDLHFIHQNLGLIDEFNAVENLMVTRPTAGRSFAPARSRRERQDAIEQLALFDQDIDLVAPVSRLAPAERAVIAITRALSGWTHAQNVLILDEPTESLHRTEVDTLFSAVRKVAERGAGIIFISHRLDEVLSLAHRIVVLRDGKLVADRPRAEVDHEALVELIAGEPRAAASATRPASSARVEAAVLDVKGLHSGILNGVDLSIRPGEILGVSGMLGSGREEVSRAIFDASRGSADQLRLAGELVGIGTPKQSIARGIGFVPGDRLRHGSIPEMDATENLTLADMTAYRNRLGVISRGRERRDAQQEMDGFDVRPRDPRKIFRTFSGGNQQKIVLLKWLRTRPRVLLLEEPTQGVDIAAKAEIFTAIRDAAAEGLAVLVCSSDAKELAQICHRVIVLNEGEIVGEVLEGEITEATLIRTGHIHVQDGDDPGIAAEKEHS